MIVTTDRATDVDAPGQFLRADRPLSPTAASDLPLSGGTAATFDVQLSTLPAATLGLGLPIGLTSSGTYARAEQIQVGGVGPLDLDAAIGAGGTTTAMPPDGATTFLMSAMDGVAAIAIAPIPSDPITPIPSPAQAQASIEPAIPTPGSGTAPPPPVASGQVPPDVTPDVVRTMASDVAGAMHTLAEALASVSTGATSQPLATTAATVAAVQAGLAQLTEKAGSAVDGLTTNVASTADDILTSGTDLVGNVAASAGDAIDAVRDTVVDVTENVSETVGTTAASIAGVTATVTAEVGAAVSTATNAAGDTVSTIPGVAGDIAAVTIGTAGEVASEATGLVTETVENTFTGTDPAAGVATLVDMLQTADGFAIDGTAGETIFASVGAALVEPIDALTGLDGDAAAPEAPLIDHHSLDDGLTGDLGGLLGGMVWDHGHG